jgi:protein-S-isoprenylcysteine O-methyltransferase Ste14
MAITVEERRFLRHWEDQRRGGKKAYVGIYTFGYFIVIFMMGVAAGLFSGLRFVTIPILSGMALFSLVGAVALSLWQWKHYQKKFRVIISREMGEHG